MRHTPSIVRINGVLPELSTLGDKEKSERAAEVEQTGMSTNTSVLYLSVKKLRQQHQQLIIKKYFIC